jgi:hypothetical protein
MFKCLSAECICLKEKSLLDTEDFCSQTLKWDKVFWNSS